MSFDRIMWIGDSIIKGSAGGVQPEQTFVRMVSLELGYLTSNIYNYGVSGDTLAGVLGRLPDAISVACPHRCVVMIGVNDFVSGIPVTPDQYKNRLYVLAGYLAQRNIPLTLISSNMLRGIPNSQFQAWDAFMDALEEVVATLNINYIDLYREMTYKSLKGGLDDLYVDDIHLTVAGHQYVAEYLLRPINRRMF